MKKLRVLYCIFIAALGVQAQPTITNFTPASGPVGTSVTITGTNFNTTAVNNVVYFGATKATVSTATATSMTVTVPVGATYQPISELNTATGLAGFSASPFVTTFIPNTNITPNDFMPGVDFAAVDYPRAIAIADFDGDGKPDLATSNNNNGGIISMSVYLNTSVSGSITGSSFAARQDFTTAAGAFRSIKVSDIDGDGKPDLVIPGSSYISVFRNTSVSGSITFATRVDILSSGGGGLSPDVAIGDIDGDGKPDLTVLGGPFVYRNTSVSGSITFDPGVYFAAGGSPFTLLIGDIDGDGKPDMAVGNAFSNTLSVLRNTAVSGIINTSSFAAAVNFASTNDLRAITLGDLDGDDKPDLVVGNYNGSSVSVFRNASVSGTVILDAAVNFTTVGHMNSIAIGDIDGDGKPDLVTDRSVLRNTSTIGTITSSSFAAKVDITAIGSESVAIADIDGDGIPDLVSTSSSNITVIQNKHREPPTIASFTPASGPVGTSVTIIGTNFNTAAVNNVVYFGATKATVSASTSTSMTVTVPVGATYEPITELNMAINLGCSSAAPFITTFSPNLGTINANSFESKVDFATGSGPNTVAVGDIDGDGKADVAVANYYANTVSVYRNTSVSGLINSGSLATKVDFVTGANPNSIDMADLDGDGKLELVVANRGSNTVSVFRNTSTSGSITSGSLAAKVDFTTGNIPSFAAVGDIDGDGKADLAVCNNGGNTVSLFQNTSVTGSISSSSFAAKVDFTNGTNPRVIIIGDIDGDGKPDVATVNETSNDISVFRNTSVIGVIDNSSLASKVDFTTGTTPWWLAIGDIDGDGKSDIAVANYFDHTVSLFKNTSVSGAITSSSFASKVDFATATNPHSVVIGDLDGDGKPEVVSSNYGSNSISVFRNTATSGTIANGSLATKVDFTTGGAPNSVALSDIDSDGKLDLISSNFLSNMLSILRNSVERITTGTISGSPFCAGASVSVPFTVNIPFSSGNVFTAQLSNASGSFANPVNIGTLSANGSGSINATIPVGTATGTGYRIRVNGSVSVVAGTDNGTDITINAITISTGTITGTPLCAEVNVIVPFTVSCPLGSGNVFTAQLSNASGSFTSPVNIATLTGNTNGNISAIIPGGTASGTGYRIRVVGSTPAITGTDNGTDITINAITISTG
ncbi:MAG: FG-GAP-like repeat-containing protein, partial [Bacteroidota bacterium]